MDLTALTSVATSGTPNQVGSRPLKNLLRFCTQGTLKPQELAPVIFFLESVCAVKSVGHSWIAEP